MSERLHIDRQHGQQLFRDMLRIRRFEAKCAELYQAQKIRGFLHLYDGEEAVAVGVMQALEAHDAVVATYRDHGHAIARGLAMGSLMAEMYGKVEGCSRGRGGSMHFFDRARRFYGGNAIVGGGLPLSIGIALADKELRPGAVTACFFGEGAAGEGEFHESMNLAELWELPVIFVCENNLYAMGMPLELAEAETDIFRKAQAYRMPSEKVDGMNPVAVEAASLRAVERARSGKGPSFLECRTYRFRAHSMFDAQLYRTKEEIALWKERDPVPRMQAWLEENHMLSAEELKRIEDQVDVEIDAAVAFAEAGQWEKVEDLERFVLMDEVPE
ncbi:pyruvate dehydrogenase (acetyl-transferring) E1 component subunit alpha [Mesorhizobium sp.]|uniref:pyruvate dehydrogenase (acetyl-transferring) E1 component subunit alpha n=1 Tax=Mesorhizobium sp. TaxID=1871066 RepID=UPI0011F65078|nr:pyruvate dehydrogenase (acetyl-transferring) E1 component subunit alpha [Mesorhizobium sp.]TIO05599.1 MAG: pyruvate dehydrogenase (acetyl-transferring) E1 component subunit alpha [Mesorhizobium sp.]TIO29913.1 MAG: pyruvate dehydrogenase (acetyl-transferring) E1 component subunit alpha [Mesorhizobium sp.]TIP08804.1 MAG: pyruvate dehydrogenase (acetyl-transferring) E1 component subunit alpha [Mesorhizobium sp.]